MRPAHLAAAGLLAGVLLDDVFGDPRRWHPVAGFGWCATRLESLTYRDTLASGVAFTAVAVVAPVTLAFGAARLVRHRPFWSFLLTAGGCWSVLGGKSLRRAGSAMATELHAGDLAAARVLLPTLCGRDAAGLDPAGLARATIESVAENTSDSVVAPLLWGAVAGVPGLVGYRAINTLDAMVGHRSARYARFGTASARLDDVANLVPARVSACLSLVSAPLVAGSPATGWQAWRADAAKHPSPNAGCCEAAMAGVLRVQLGGPTRYSYGLEDRPTLGSGPDPAPVDIARSVRVSYLVQLGAVLLSVGISMLGKGFRK